jgi:hypothetical protein
MSIKTSFQITAAAFLLFIIPAIGGCGKSIDPQIAVLRSKILVAQEPSSAITLTEAKDLLTEENDVVLIGKIGSGALDPFEKGKAIFVLSEAPEDHGKDASHDASECPFCRRKAELAPIAQIEFQNPSGATLPFSVPELLGLKNGQIVVVHGKGKYDKESDMLLIQADQLFVKP